MPNTGYINDLIDPLELVNFVRNINFYDVTVFERYFPTQTVDDIQYRYTKGQLLDQDAAVYRAYDTPSPIGKRQGFARMTGELPPLSKKISLGEEEQLRHRALDTGRYAPIIDAIYNDAANLARSIQIRLEIARGELLSAGTVTLSENGVNAQYVAGVPSDHFVAPAVTNWDNTAADILGDLRTWQDKFILDTHGATFTEMVVSRKTMNYMLNNTAIRQLTQYVLGAPLEVSRDQLNSILTTRDLPTVTVDDRMFSVAGTATRLIPQNKVILTFPNQLGTTFLGTPLEAIEAASRGVITAEEAPGIWASTWQDNEPIRTWTRAGAIGVPIMGNPLFHMVATVY